MRQDRIARVCALIALLAAVAAAPAGAATVASSPGVALRTAPAAETMAKKSTSKSKAKARKSLRQFTGTVIALDKKGFTVEKGSKKVRTMVFVRHEKMRTTGDLEKGVRVTVYYREEGDQAVAHRVVVKEETANSE